LDGQQSADAFNAYFSSVIVQSNSLSLYFPSYTTLIIDSIKFNPFTTANCYTHPIPPGSTLTPVCFLNISSLFCTYVIRPTARATAVAIVAATVAATVAETFCSNGCCNCCSSFFAVTVAATVAEPLQQFVVDAIIFVTTSCLLLDLCFKLQHLFLQLLQQFCIALVGSRLNKISCTLSDAMRKVSIVLRLNVVHK